MALAVLLGVALGLIYDLLKAVRLRARRAGVTVLLDIFFCAVLTLALFSFGLGPGNGSLRLFMLAGVGLGGLAYSLSISPYALKIYAFLVECTWTVVSPIAKTLAKTRKVVKNAKNIFPKNDSRGTMIRNIRKGRKESHNAGEGSDDIEARKGRFDYSACHRGSGAVRTGEPRIDPEPDREIRPASRRASGRGKRAGKRKRGT